MLVAGAVCHDTSRLEAEHANLSVTQQYVILQKTLNMMHALVIDQLCSDGLATDHTVQQLCTGDEVYEVQLRKSAAQHASSTVSAASSGLQEGQLGQESADQFRPAPLLAQPFKAWPQPSSKQWASIVIVANKASMLYAWLASRTNDQQAQTDEFCMRI